jgi:biopolymer transport protein ExbD
MGIQAPRKRWSERLERSRVFGQGAQSDSFPGDVYVQADKGVHFGVIKRVMFSCTAAGYTNINFLAKPD